MFALLLAVNVEHGALSSRPKAEAALSELTSAPGLANPHVWQMPADPLIGCRIPVQYWIRSITSSATVAERSALAGNLIGPSRAVGK